MRTTSIFSKQWQYFLMFILITLCAHSYASPMIYIAEVKGQTAEFDSYQKAYNFVLSLYPTSSPTSKASDKEEEIVYFFSDYCFANDSGFNSYGYGWFGAQNPQYCGFSSAQAVVDWIVPDSQERCPLNVRMNPEFFGASLASGYRETTRDYSLRLEVDAYAGCGTIQGDLRISYDRIIVKGESAKITMKKICYAPYLFDQLDVLGEDLKTGCVKRCPTDKPDLVNGVCTGPEVIQQCKGNPVIVSNGTKIQTEAPDMLTTGAYPLYFARNYNSQRSLESQELRQQSIQILPTTNKSKWMKHIQPAGYKGENIGYVEMLVPPTDGIRLAGYKSWTHNYFGLLEVLGNTVRLNSSQFADRRFTQQEDGSYKPTNITSDSLTRIEDEVGTLLHWVYRSASNQTEQYNTQGQLIRRTNSAGLSHHLTYDANGNIEVVKDDANNQLLFAYDDKNKLTTLTSSNGEVVTYGYDQFANLETVTKKLASGKETVRRYHYEDSRHPYALTGITDENGARYASWEYDAFGRAVVSKHANDTDKTTFEFDVNKTIVTNPLGKQTIYNYNTIAGAKRLETVEGVATTSCLAANQNYEYYPDGQLKSKTDHKGNITEFVYNERGLEVQRTEAVGTAQQRIISTTWHPQFNLPISVTVGNQVTTYDYDSNGLLTSQSKSHL
ncbi:hypothetical protein [Psychromonas sp. MME2]|uniref:hypothetical protein n=1 Tax=unclassified Psychromonas TaxID=2614957 RepID=UPI00339C3D03